MKPDCQSSPFLAGSIIMERPEPEKEELPKSCGLQGWLYITADNQDQRKTQHFLF